MRAATRTTWDDPARTVDGRLMSPWGVALLISAAIAISYLDRQTLPVAVKAIQRDIPLSNEQFSSLQSMFLFSYALMYAAGGRLVDALGTRRGFILIMVVWSLACASHALATTVLMLAISRFLLGMGEGGGFPAATRAVAEWFSPRQRATAMGIINAGTAVGAVAAPPLIALVLAFLSWRWIFIVTGAAGLLWTAWWSLSYSSPPANLHPAPPLAASPASPRPLVLAFLSWRWIFIVTGAAGLLWTAWWSLSYSSPPANPQPAPPLAASPASPRPLDFHWLDLLRIRESWGLVTAKFLSDAAWYFYLFWLPKYLYDARGFDIKAVGASAWIPYAAAGIGCLGGGWFSSYLVQRQFSLGMARKLALGFSAALMPFVIFVPYVAVASAFVIFSLAYLGQQSWSTLVMVLPADLFPARVVGSVAGLVGFGGAMGGIAFGELAGYLLDHGFGYKVVFALAGTFHVIGFVIILIAIPVVSPLTLDGHLSYEGVR